MTELKTLKDMNLNDDDGYNEAILKQEAIKWIKKWRLEIEEEAKTHIRGEHNPKISKLQGKIEATMELNNITDEDLEEQGK